jgi:hypothetical protein
LHARRLRQLRLEGRGEASRRASLADLHQPARGLALFPHDPERPPRPHHLGRRAENLDGDGALGGVRESPRAA